VRVGVIAFFWLCHYARRIRESTYKAKEKRGLDSEKISGVMQCLAKLLTIF
jgi:ABC-type dipeptide/oligopeptide/nickel transport system permease subunit